MTNALVIPEVRHGSLTPCAYIRLFLPLTKPGVSDTLHARFVRSEQLEELRADAVIAHRVSLPTPAEVDRVVRYSRKVGARLIYDIDDDLLALGTDHPEGAHFARFKPAILCALANADQVWVSTAALADAYRALARDIIVIPNTLDHRLWHTQPVQGPAAASDVVRFMCMGTPTHRADFNVLIAPGFEKLAAEFGGRVQLDTIGVIDMPGPGKPWSRLMPAESVAVSYPGFAAWLQSQQGFSVGLAPLCDTAFSRGKSNIKWLEYSALGLATIAADLPPYRSGTRRDEDIVLCEPTPEAFHAAMRALVVDDGSRQRLRMRAAALANEQLLQSASGQEIRLGIIDRLVFERRMVRAPIRLSRSEISMDRLNRNSLSRAFLRGSGIEIGALHNPLSVAEGLQVKYVDRMRKRELYEHYPELRGHPLVEVDIIDDGETLASIAAESQDFIIANHFLEHCQDPIATLKSFARVLAAGGIVYMAIPDKRFTFDRDRERTPLSHLIEDHASGPAASRGQHFREWVTLVEPQFGHSYDTEAAVEERVRLLQDQDYSIHFHAWTPEDISCLIEHCIDGEGMPFDVLFAGEFNSEHEMIYILRKT
jgi:SAM-dependent methyltransferase